MCHGLETFLLSAIIGKNWREWNWIGNPSLMFSIFLEDIMHLFFEFSRTWIDGLGSLKKFTGSNGYLQNSIQISWFRLDLSKFPSKSGSSAIDDKNWRECDRNGNPQISYFGGK
jgi:hypothetical protein